MLRPYYRLNLGYGISYSVSAPDGTAREHADQSTWLLSALKKNTVVEQDHWSDRKFEHVPARHAPHCGASSAVLEPSRIGRSHIETLPAKRFRSERTVGRSPVASNS